jgi:hypothetical protein
MLKTLKYFANFNHLLDVVKIKKQHLFCVSIFVGHVVIVILEHN